jgi:glycosyltransferase involved in cell wall biosynthesis
VIAFQMKNGLLHPPRIEPVTEGLPRPLWSVMIPTFERAHYLRKTLASVLSQDPGPEQMQIEVVDDCSINDDPEAVVREMGNGRVAFYRQPSRQRMEKNFNTCIRRSRGQLVHILHGDDYVLPGFYERLSEVAARHPGVALIASRSFLIDRDDIITGVTERLPELESGGHIVDRFFYRTPIQTPGVVVRRAFYEGHGGFLLNLPYIVDCELWTRAITLAGGVVTPDVLACYRVYEANDSARVARTAENLLNLERLNRLFAERYAGFDSRAGLYRVLNQALAQAEHFAKLKDSRAVKVNLAYWKSAAPAQIRLRRAAGKIVRTLFG